MTQHALVTGASSGLGREFVRQLVIDRGMTVLATARRADRLESVAAELPPGRVLVEPGDVTDAAFRRRLWDRAETLPGGIDLLINNAGLGHYAEFADQDPGAADRVVALNVVALMDLTRMAAASMKRRGSGRILQISSVLGFYGIPYSAAYVASKHAVNGLVKCLRYELHGSGVRIQCACPGRTESEFSTVALADPASTGPRPAKAPVDRVVRQILRGMDRGSTFIFPTWSAWATVALAVWLPGPYHLFMERWGPKHFREELELMRGNV